MSVTVAARVRPEVKDFLDQEAKKRATTTARLVEELVLEEYREKNGGSQSGGESGDLPEGVYRPDGKHDFAVKYEGPRGVERKYYKTRKGAIERAERESTVPV
jgi:hypothetical protein